MIRLIKDDKEHNYKIYKSDVIENHYEEMIHTIRTAHTILMKKYSVINPSSTWLYQTYNIFSLVGQSEHFHQLYKDLVLIIKNQLPDENMLWFQSWVNYHKPDEVLDWHNHYWHTHGFICLDPKESDTVFKNYTIHNEIGNIYIGPGNRQHKVEVLKPYEGERITLGFDVTVKPELPRGMLSFIPII
jgi:hypothetical protein